MIWIGGAYGCGMVATYLYIMRPRNGPWITPGLAAVRSVVWPLWWLTGIPTGRVIG